MGIHLRTPLEWATSGCPGSGDMRFSKAMQRVLVGGEFRIGANRSHRKMLP